LNKKSAQKQKHLRNNGFSQAVVPQKAKAYTQQKLKQNLKKI
jgi:hypothetical protein